MRHTCWSMSILLVILIGCVHKEQRQSPLSIYIPIFENKTIQYGLEERITNLLIEELLKDDDLEISPQEETSTAVLKGEITSYQRTPISYDQNGGVKRYKVYLQIAFSLYSSMNQGVLFQKQIDETVTYASTESEETAIENALLNLAHDIARLIGQENDIIVNQEQEAR